MTDDTIHTCSYECERPECIRRQRDELRDRMEAALASAPPSAPVGVEDTAGELERYADCPGNVEAVLRLFLTEDGYIAECDIPHIVVALTAQPAISGYTCTVPDDCETLHWRGQILSMNELAALAQQPAAVDGLAARLVDELDGLVSESDGVSGLHLNGDVATWEELLPGGRFERLSSLDELREALAAQQQGGRADG